MELASHSSIKFSTLSWIKSLRFLTIKILTNDKRLILTSLQIHILENNLPFYVHQACKFLDESWSPKFTVIVAQKNHHTKFFQDGSPDNVPPGCHSQTLIERASLINFW
jgi:hypothetical protein